MDLLLFSTKSNNINFIFQNCMHPIPVPGFARPRVPQTHNAQRTTPSAYAAAGVSALTISMIFTRGFSRLDRRVASRRSLLSTKNKEQRGSNAVGRGTWEHSLGQEEKEDTLKRCTPTPVCFVATELRSHGATEPRRSAQHISAQHHSALGVSSP